MIALTTARKKNHLSQRELARLSGVSYKTLQLVENNKDTKISTLKNLAKGMGYGEEIFSTYLDDFFYQPIDSIFIVSCRIKEDSNWKIHLFDFVDAFIQNPCADLVSKPPIFNLDKKFAALLTSCVETLCDSKKMVHPFWTQSINSLDEPWFVAGIENLKASALMESPIHFRKRNIFVLSNFLERA